MQLPPEHPKLSESAERRACTEAVPSRSRRGGFPAPV